MTYWKNAWKTPTEICPMTSMPPARRPMVTWQRRMSRRIAGAIAWVTKSAVPEASASASAASRISAALASSRPKALMTARPL